MIWYSEISIQIALHINLSTLYSPEWSPAVSADEALGVELVPHGGDHSVQTRLVAHTADGGGGPLVWAEKIFILWF